VAKSEPLREDDVAWLSRPVELSQQLGPPAGTAGAIFIARVLERGLAHVRDVFDHSMLQDDWQAVRPAFLQTFQPIAMSGLAGERGRRDRTEPIVLVLLGEKWLVGVMTLRILAFDGLLRLLSPIWRGLQGDREAASRPAV
jgi:hypothetical protein